MRMMAAHYRCGRQPLLLLSEACLSIANCADAIEAVNDVLLLLSDRVEIHLTVASSAAHRVIPNIIQALPRDRILRFRDARMRSSQSIMHKAH